MPRCKHKMYCVFFFKGGGSQLIANQTGDGQVYFCSNDLMFVQYREEMKGKN